MKLSFFPLLAALLFLASCAPTIYLAPGFEKVKRKHEKVAILPFEVEVTSKKLPKGVTPESLREQMKSNGYSMQSEVYSQFLRQQTKGRKYTVEFQDVDKTNALLKSAGIEFEDLRTSDKGKLADALGVDAVISGKIIQDKPMSDGAAVALGVIFGVWGSTNKVDAHLTIHAKDEGKLLWKYDYEASGSVGSSTQNLAEALMRNASRKFPYQQD